MQRPQPTIIEVAQAAGVAVSTVSRVLNGGSASAKMQARVQRAVSDLGFQPSAAARNLKLGKTGIVGLAGASTRAPWFAQLLDGMQGVLLKQATSLAICGWATEESDYEPAPMQAWITGQRIDHLVLVRPGEAQRALARQALKTGIPVVSVVPDINLQGALSVRADNREGGRLAAEHLLALGHRKIAFLGGPETSIDTMDRLHGLRETMAEKGLKLPREQVRFGQDYEPASGVDLAEKWLRSKHLRQTTAVVLGNDAIALGFMRVVQAAGLKIPQDVSVVGFDGVDSGALTYPALTTVAQPITQMGRDIAHHLLAPLPTSPRLLEYRLNLVERESTAVPSIPKTFET